MHYSTYHILLRKSVSLAIQIEIPINSWIFYIFLISPLFSYKYLARLSFCLKYEKCSFFSSLLFCFSEVIFQKISYRLQDSYLVLAQPLRGVCTSVELCLIWILVFLSGLIVEKKVWITLLKWQDFVFEFFYILILNWTIVEL